LLVVVAAAVAVEVATLTVLMVPMEVLLHSQV